MEMEWQLNDYGEYRSPLLKIKYLLCILNLITDLSFFTFIFQCVEHRLLHGRYHMCRVFSPNNCRSRHYHISASL